MYLCKSDVGRDDGVLLAAAHTHPRNVMAMGLDRLPDATPNGSKRTHGNTLGSGSCERRLQRRPARCSPATHTPGDTPITAYLHYS